MKLETATDLYFVVSILVPGFIYNGVLGQFIPLHRYKEKELVILRLLTATAFNYALCSPAIYMLVYGNVIPDSPIPRAALWFAIIFLVPVELGLMRAKFIQTDGVAWFYRLLKLRPINPIPTGWDWIFGRTDPCFLLITLTDGTEIAGYFGGKSMASSDPDRKDIYIEKVYRVPEDGSTWTEVTGSLGMHVNGAQIAYIEFKE